jgi:ribosome-associated protein
LNPKAPAQPAARVRAPKKAAQGGPSAEALNERIRFALEELKARDIREIDVRGKSGFTDTLFIASGTSSRHVKSIADEVQKRVKEIGAMPLGVEGEREAEWVLVDLGDAVVHVFLPRVRELYALERLWSVDGDTPSAADAETDEG